MSKASPLRTPALWLAACGLALVLAEGRGVTAGLPWIALASLFALSLIVAARRPGDRLESLERHVMRCRRREEGASVLVARVSERNGLKQEALLACFRLTDSIAVRRNGRGLELAGVFDHEGLDRAGVERRLRAVAGETELQLAWSLFPDDGVTLHVLLDAARAELPAPARRAARHPAEAGVRRSPLTSGAEGE
jgi:hypothetical protein